MRKKSLSWLLVIAMVMTLFAAMPMTASAEGVVCEIVGGSTYTTLDSAIVAAPNGTTIRLLTDIMHSSMIDVMGKSFTIDVNDYMLTVNPSGTNCVQSADGFALSIVDNGDNETAGAFNVTVSGENAMMGLLAQGNNSRITVNVPTTINATGTYCIGVMAEDGGVVTVSGNVLGTGTNSIGAWATGSLNGGSITIDGTIDAPSDIKINLTTFDVPNQSTTPTTKEGYLTYMVDGDSANPQNTVWVKDNTPYATNVAITGNPVVGESLTGTYDFNGTTESGTTFRWLKNSGTPQLITQIHSIAGVSNNPPNPSIVTLGEDSFVTLIYTYHYYNYGQLPGTIALQEVGGDETVFGPWAAIGFEGSGSPNAYWTVYPNVTLPAGEYKVIDSHPATWSWTEDAGGRGLVYVYGNPTYADTDIYAAIDGATAQTYTLTPAEVGCMMKFEVTPKDSGGLVGTSVASSAVGPVSAPIEDATCVVPNCTDPHADGVFTEFEIIDDHIYYHISTAEQLAHINEHLDLNYIQTADIDLSQYNGGLWNPIGGYLGYEEFSGQYLGNGHQITNMTIDVSSTDGSILYAGLFGLTSVDAHIEGISLNINDLSAVQDNGVYGEVYLGGIAAVHRSAGTIEDCHVTIDGDITATSYGGNVYVGGITGYNTGNINNCSTITAAESTVTVAAPGQEAFIGGIAGYTSGNILNSDNAGKLHAEAGAETYTSRVYVGGIAGYVSTSSTNTIIENCENNADIESINLCNSDNTYRAYAGGIVGHIYFENPQVVEITNCANIGADKQVYTKAPSTMTGGIAGSSRFTQAVCTTIKNCYNRSDVISEMLDFDYNKKVPTFCTGVTAGGTIGAAGGIKIWYTYSTAANISATAMEGEDAYEGGIAGLIYDTILLENYYESNSNIVDGVGGAIDTEMNIVPQLDVVGEVEGATTNQLKTKTFFGDGWQWYNSGGTEPAYYSSTAPWRFVAANSYPVLRGLPYTPTPPNGGGSYTPSTYRITSTANVGGEITPAGNSIVTEYGSITFTIKPDKNYIIKDVLVDGASIGTVTTYTFSSVRSNHTIEAIFAHDCPSKPFTDVDITQWYHEGIDYVLLAGLFKGTSATTFEPNTSMTRAMLVTVLHRLEGTPAATGNTFSDVASGKWYTNAVVWANVKGIVKGYDSDTFGTNDFITREQLATILYRYAQYKGYDVSVGEDTNILSYEDAFNISEYAIPAVQWVCGTGIMQGDAAKLEPQGNATRAQVAAMLMRFIENVVK